MKDGKPFTWLELEKLLAEARAKGEKYVLALLKQEQSSLGRPNFLLRIYGRYSVMRRARERREILQGKVPN